MRQPAEAVFESGSNILLDREVTPDDLRAILGMLAFAPAIGTEAASHATAAPGEEANPHPPDSKEDAPAPDAALQPETTTVAPLREPPEPPIVDTPMHERDLISIAQSDSPQASQAFGELFAGKSQWLDTVLTRKVPNFADRADIVQEAGMKAFKAFGKYDATRNSTFSSWILTIANNAAADFYRRAAARPQPAANIDPVLLDIAADDDVAAQVLAPLGFKWILEKVGDIEAETKGSGRDLVDLLTKIYVHDMSVNEYAKDKGIPPGTVKSRLSHAYSLIREFLPPDSQRRRKRHIGY